jgi:hypothetical protein
MPDFLVKVKANYENYGMHATEDFIVEAPDENAILELAKRANLEVLLVAPAPPRPLVTDADAPTPEA